MDPSKTAKTRVESGMHVDLAGRRTYADYLKLDLLLAAQQPVTISGAITSDAGQPLGQAEVSIPALGVGTLSKDDGRFTFVIPGARVSGQTVALTARRLGYKPGTCGSSGVGYLKTALDHAFFPELWEVRTYL